MNQGGALYPPDKTRNNGFNRRPRPSDPPPDYGGFTDISDQKVSDYLYILSTHVTILQPCGGISGNM